MSNIKEIKKESDVKQTLQECLDQADGLECVVILAIDNDGRQWLRTSSINQHKKSFLFGDLVYLILNMNLCESESW